MTHGIEKRTISRPKPHPLIPPTIKTYPRLTTPADRAGDHARDGGGDAISNQSQHARKRTLA